MTTEKTQETQPAPQPTPADHYLHCARNANSLLSGQHLEDVGNLFRAALSLLSPEQLKTLSEHSAVADIVKRGSVPPSERPVYGGYTEAQLQEAFSKVRNKKHWKYPITATIQQSDFDVTSAAVTYFTGSHLEVVRVLKGGKRVRVEAAGYFAAVGA